MPACMGMRFVAEVAVLGLCLFSGADSASPPGYRSVMRWLTNGLRHLHGLALPTSSALTKARQRLGSKPLELLFDLRRGALAGSGTPGAFAIGLRLQACDGTGLDAADTPANAREFGVTQGRNPQLRLLALVECGTHALIDAVFDGVTKASEHKLARRLLHALTPGMLLLADRNFPGHQLWGLVAASRADPKARYRQPRFGCSSSDPESPRGFVISEVPVRLNRRVGAGQ
ncbi:MAG: transposase, family [Actinomycetia bacterium]|nr:transposase, family [Actinomycetes bacterium]